MISTKQLQDHAIYAEALARGSAPEALDGQFLKVAEGRRSQLIKSERHAVCDGNFGVPSAPVETTRAPRIHMPPKPDFPPLLAPGMHTHTLASIHALAVAPFAADAQRTSLFSRFGQWFSALQAANVTGRIWIDGSFLTEKPGPGDIDAVIWNPAYNAAGPTPSSNTAVAVLLDRNTAGTLYGIDLYVVCVPPKGMFDCEAYWRGVFGYCHNRVTAKGFAELQL